MAKNRARDAERAREAVDAPPAADPGGPPAKPTGYSARGGLIVPLVLLGLIGVIVILELITR